MVFINGSMKNIHKMDLIIMAKAQTEGSCWGYPTINRGVNSCLQGTTLQKKYALL
jgi:hypothetical protein